MHFMRKILLIGALCLLCFLMGAAAQKNYQLFINGTPSTTKLIEGEEGLLVPLTLPANPGVSEWSITIEREAESPKVEVALKQIKKKVRGGEDCYYCSGTGKCPQDYPAGSGLDYAGKNEYYCNGTGKCYHCAGTGKSD